jgi:hypothetical protein
MCKRPFHFLLKELVLMDCQVAESQIHVQQFDFGIQVHCCLELPDRRNIVSFFEFDLAEPKVSDTARGVPLGQFNGQLVGFFPFA